MPTSEKFRELAARLNKGERTIWYWISQGCDISSEESVRQFSEGKRLRRTNIEKAREKLDEGFGLTTPSLIPGDRHHKFSGK